MLLKLLEAFAITCHFNKFLGFYVTVLQANLSLAYNAFQEHETNAINFLKG